MGATHNTISVLMLPWLAHGHISPFLELAKMLTTRNFHIYFCTTPINLSPIKQQLSEKDSLSIELVELHLPSLPELPPHYHTANGLPPHLMPTLKKAVDMASPWEHWWVVSHCGWSSVMESMKFGVPIIAMPMHLDQPVNSRLVEALGVGVEVKRDTNGRLEREEAAKVIRKVLVEKTP